VLIVCYRRVDVLEEQLRRLAAQDFSGTFEVVLWNNSPDERQRIDEIVSRFADAIDVRVVHSSDNLYCAPRFAMPGLMRSETLLMCDDDVLPSSSYLQGFWNRFHELGGEGAICARGHRIEPHELDEDRPDGVWEAGKHLRFFDERAPETTVDFMHADNCMIGRDLLARAAQIRMEYPEDVLVDDYWLSYVLQHQVGVQLRKITADHLFAFTPSADDPELAMFHSPAVRDQRINFYVRHMRAGWVGRP
jgi:GT2 family glycosyltransferase